MPIDWANIYAGNNDLRHNFLQWGVVTYNQTGVTLAYCCELYRREPQKRKLAFILEKWFTPSEASIAATMPDWFLWEEFNGAEGKPGFNPKIAAILAGATSTKTFGQKVQAYGLSEAFWGKVKGDVAAPRPELLDEVVDVNHRALHKMESTQAFIKWNPATVYNINGDNWEKVRKDGKKLEKAGFDITWMGIRAR